jgi:hypothetical protein
MASSATGVSASNGSSGAEVHVEALGEGIGVHAGEDAAKQRGWFTKLARWYLARCVAKREAEAERHATGASASDRANRAILVACVKSAISGALSGTVSTGATLVTAQTEGALAFATVPAAAAAIGGEMLYRSIVHLDLTSQLAAIFGMHYDPSHEEDLWRLYALAFGTSDHEGDEDDAEGDPGQELVREVSHVEAEDVGEKIGHLVLGESIMRNVVPVVGIVASAVTNVVMTRKVGHTVRRYMRYQRAFSDSFAHAVELLAGEPLDLLIEGMWFIFTADGRLSPEEAACLGKLVNKLDPVSRHALTARFVEDELDWTDRLPRGVPEPLRDVFMHALEVAAAVDKEVSVPERKILRRAARALGRELDMERVAKMMEDFEEYGVLRTGAKGGGALGAHHAK